ncbi:hypothetical protein [Paracoccus sp. N5]|uniref:hypothetical protein n=1 Tax=Paracoccus sp. N5 TaxID=1101189 RepID=UPI0012F98479|nr:hypothetical protein [Paracoccus sp. N5]
MLLAENLYDRPIAPAEIEADMGRRANRVGDETAPKRATGSLPTKLPCIEELVELESAGGRERQAEASAGGRDADNRSRI